MRTLALAFFATCAPVLAQTNYGTITFTNKSGDVINNAVVTKVEAGKLTYRYSVGVGGGVVSLSDLPEGLRARFGDSPDRTGNAAALQRPGQPTAADRKKFEETKAKAEKGDAQAQADLGGCYYEGYGVTEDAVEAVKWYRKAAEQGLAGAQCLLGLCYEIGDGVTQDWVQAVKWYRKAAEQGLAQAQFYLGDCCDHGHGVTQDAVEAVKWFRKAAEQGDSSAQDSLGACYEIGDGVAKDWVQAEKWHRKAAAPREELTLAAATEQAMAAMKEESKVRATLAEIGNKGQLQILENLHKLGSISEEQYQERKLASEQAFREKKRKMEEDDLQREIDIHQAAIDAAKKAQPGLDLAAEAAKKKSQAAQAELAAAKSGLDITKENAKMTAEALKQWEEAHPATARLFNRLGPNAAPSAVAAEVLKPENFAVRAELAKLAASSNRLAQPTEADHQGH